MAFQINTSFSVTEPAAAVGTDMFLYQGVMYYLALQADHLTVHTAPTKAGEEFTELFRIDLPVGFVPNEARIGDVLEGQFLISVYSNSGDYQAHFYEVKPYFLGDELGGYIPELVATYVPSTASSTYRLKPARWSYGTKSTYLFVGRYGTTAGDFAVFKGGDGVVQSGIANTVLTGHSFASLSVATRGLQWWDEAEQVWYKVAYPNSGDSNNDDPYLCKVDLNGEGSLITALPANSFYNNAYRRNGEYYCVRHTQTSSILDKIDKSSYTAIGAGATTDSPYYLGYIYEAMNYGKESGFMYLASSQAYGVWWNRGDYNPTTSIVGTSTPTGFAKYTVSLREDVAELLPYSRNPYTIHSVVEQGVYGDYGLSMGTGLGTKPSTTLSIGTIVGDKSQLFSLPSPDSSVKLTGWVGTDQTTDIKYADGLTEVSAYTVTNSNLYPNPFNNPFLTSETVDGNTWLQGEFDAANHKFRITQYSNGVLDVGGWVDTSAETTGRNMAQSCVMGIFPAKNTVYYSLRQFSGGYYNVVYEYDLGSGTATVIHTSSSAAAYWSFGCSGEKAVILGNSTGVSQGLFHDSLTQGWVTRSVNMNEYNANLSNHNRLYYDTSIGWWRGWLKTSGTAGHRMFTFDPTSPSVVYRQNTSTPVIVSSAMCNNDYYAVTDTGKLLGITAGSTFTAGATQSDLDYWSADLSFPAGSVLRSSNGMLFLLQPDGVVKEVVGSSLQVTSETITPFTPFANNQQPRLSQHTNPEVNNDHLLLLSDDGSFNTQLTRLDHPVERYGEVNADLQWLPSL